jgi:ketosteroid isomerase-like protein
MATNDVLVHAEKAYNALLAGFRTGEWKGFFDLLSDEVDCILPAPEPGHYKGAEGRKKMIDFFGRLRGDLTRIAETEIVAKTVAEDRVVFEDWARGTFFNKPYAARHCIHIMIRNGKVVGSHEYNSPLD